MIKRLLVLSAVVAGLTMPAFAQQSVQPPDRPAGAIPDAPSDPPGANMPGPRFMIEDGTTGQGNKQDNRGEPDYDPNFDPTAREPRRNQPGVELLDGVTE